MSVGFFGIQFAFGLQNANVSRIFQTLGASIDDIPILWIAAPITGLLVQPYIGHLSDRTWLGKWGRRRPFFIAGAIVASLALFVFPSAHYLWVAAVLLWLLDAGINVAMEPFRAFVGDMLPESQRTKGFAMQSLFIGLGAVISSFLPFILTRLGVSNEAPEGVIPDSVRISFIAGAAVFILAVAYTVFTTREYSPEERKSFGETEADVVTDIKSGTGLFYRRGMAWLVAGLLLTVLLFWYNGQASTPLKKELYVLAFGIAFYGALQVLAGLFHASRRRNGFVEVMDDLNFLPPTMKKLALVQFFTWFALFSMWIYATPALAQHIAGTTDTSSVAYNDMANWVGVLFGIYNAFTAVFALLLPELAKNWGRPVTHLVALVVGGIGLISFYFLRDKELLIFSMAAVGFGWCSILAMPYSMLTSAVPSHKMGVFMGIFNFFIVIPQILAATLLGFFTDNLFGGKAIYTIVLGGGFMILAGLLTLRISEKNTAD